MRIFRKLAQLLDVDVVSTPPADGDALTFDTDSSKWVPGAGGGGDSSSSVILAPATTARNVIQPTAADAAPLTLQGAATQSADLLRLVDASAVVIGRIDPAGRLYLENDLWHRSIDGKDRFHFIADGNSYWKAAVDHVWRTNDADIDKMVLDIDGVLHVSSASITNYGSSGGSVRMGVLPSDSGYGGMWVGQASPDTNNYSLLGRTGEIFFNAPGAGGVMHFRVNNSDVIQVSAAGQIQFGSDVVVAYDAGGYFGIRTFIPSGGAAVIPVVIRGAGSQTADLQEWQDSGNGVLLRVNKDGYLITAKNAAPADADVSAGELAWWYDDTNGSAKWMAKGKTADGTVVTWTIPSGSLLNTGDIGSTVQAFDADLSTWAGLTPSAFFQTLVDDSDAATARATLGVIASLFQSGGAQAIKLDDLAAPDDNTDLNVSTLKHGLAPKAPNDATKYLDGTGAYSVPAGGGGGTSSDDESLVLHMRSFA